MASTAFTVAYTLAPAVDEFGCAHIVISDANMEDEWVDACIEECTNPPDWRLTDPLGEDEDGRAIALVWLRAMRELTEDERMSIWRQRC
jgi:hypothetical protein